MSTIIKFDLKELRKLANEKNSCVIEKKVTQNLALQPWCLGNLKESLKNLLDYKIGKFDKEFNGILLSYKNLRILQNIGSIRNDNSHVHFQVQADYFIFKPFVGAVLKGFVNKKSNTHLAILLHRVFNVVIPRPTELPGNKWIGASIQEGQEITFKIVVLDLFGALPYIRGELDEGSMRLGPDGDDEVLEAKSSQATNVSYVHFEKTKPNQKLIGDGPYSSAKNAPPNISRVANNKESLKSNSASPNNHNFNGKANAVKNFDSEISVVEKNKRQSKTLEMEVKPSETNPRQSKKHRRDVV